MDDSNDLRLLTETIPVQVWTALPDGNLDFVTEQTARAFGVTAETLLREGWKDVVHPDDLATAGAAWMHSLSTGEPYEVQFRVRLHDGRYAWHLVRAVPERDASGAIVRWFGTNTDIEGQREMQRRVQALLDEMTAQAREYESSLRSLKDELAEARATIASLQKPRPST